MLQKSIIALSTIFALSACGGSLDLGPDTPPSQNGNGNGENGNGENGNGNGEPGPSQIYSYMTFSDEDSVDSWAYRCYDGCNATAELSWNGDEQVLAIMPEWASDEDHLEIYSPIDEIGNLNDAGISAWVYVTEEYYNDGNMTMQLFLTNASGATGYLAEKSPSQVGWNRLQAWELTTGDEEEEIESSFAWYEEGFNLRNINEIGVQFSANGKDADVGGPLWIDNVLLTRGSDAAGPFIVDMDSENWAVLDADGVELQQGGGTVAFSPTGNDQKLVYLLDGPVNMVGGSFTMTFSVDQAFVDSGADVQPLAQLNFGNFAGQFDGCYISNDNLTAGEDMDYTCNIDNEAIVAEEGENIRVGLQVKHEAAGTLTISYMEIDADGISGEPVDSAFNIVPTADNMGSWDNDNWQNREGAPDLSFSEEQGALVINPNWDATDNDGERTVMYVAEEGELPELEGATIAYELYIPDYYVTTYPGMQYQFYIQQDSDSFTGLFGDMFSLSDAEDLGEGWYRFERSFSDVPTDPAALRVGLKLHRAGMDNNGEAGEDVWLRLISID